MRLAASLVATFVVVASAQAQSTRLASVSTSGGFSNGSSFTGGVSADGRFVVFQSTSKDLVSPPDLNNVQDVFVFDRATGVTTKVSVDSSGATGNSFSSVVRHPVSADGRITAFVSNANNLVPGDTNGFSDVFVHDSLTGATTRVHVDSLGNQANGASVSASLGSDGRYVTFRSAANNLVAGDTNAVDDGFLHDRLTGQTTRFSVDALGNQANAASGAGNITNDGLFVVFDSDANNLVAGDTNGSTDVFVKDLVSGAIVRVSTDAAGSQVSGDSNVMDISPDGRFIGLWSFSANLVPGDTNGLDDAFVKDRLTGAVERVSVSTSGAQGNSQSVFRSISADGRFALFEGASSTFVAGDTNGAWDVFLRDRVSGTTRRVSLTSTGAQVNGMSLVSYLAQDGRTVVFYSEGTNVLPGDTNTFGDIFVREEYDIAPATYCTAKVSSHGCVPSIVGVGEPSVANPVGFSVTTAQLEQGKNTITFFGTTAFGNPFQGGFLCVKPTLFRLGVKNSGGASQCQGTVSYTLAELQAHGSGGALVVPGADVYCQTWGRDPGDAFSSSLSNGVTFMVLP